MFRTLILVLAVVGVFMILRKLLQSNSRGSSTPPTHDLVKCEHCHEYVEKSLAIRQHEFYYCSQQHLNAHQDESDT